MNKKLHIDPNRLLGFKMLNQAQSNAVITGTKIGKIPFIGTKIGKGDQAPLPFSGIKLGAKIGK